MFDPTTNEWSVSRLKRATDLVIEQATDCENSHRNMQLACNRYKIPYFRFNPPLNERIRMDTNDEDTLNKLIELTTEYMQQPDVQAQIEQLQKLIEQKFSQEDRISF